MVARLPPAQAWRHRCLYFGLALLPLLFLLLSRPAPVTGDGPQELLEPNVEQAVKDVLERGGFRADFQGRFRATLARHLKDATAGEKELAESRLAALKAGPPATWDQLLALLPQAELDGAFLPRHSRRHLFLAIISGIGFFAALLLLFPLGTAKPKHLVLAGLFAGALGVIYLVTVEYLSGLAQQGRPGGGALAVVSYVFKLIEFSYRSALGAGRGFILSFIGFTLLVGLCGEIFKLLPLAWHYRRPRWVLDWRGACLWGLAAGLGFGAAEGIVYGADFHNGVAPGAAYLVCFVSSIAFHGVCTAAAGVAMWRNQRDFQGDRAWSDLASVVLNAIAVPLILRGLYDTLLKQGGQPWAAAAALGCALAAFGWLAFQIEQARRREEELAGAPA
jgi:RsiW-degrading membrane proteinase PrsW (M82 family)